MAQRLVRTLCPDCRQSAPATDEEKRLLGITDARTVTLYHPQGCPACNHKGFRGRTAIHELIVVDATLRDLIHRQAGEQVGLAEDDTAARNLPAQHCFAVLPRVGQSAQVKRLVEDVIGIA